jgi:hypothetical protein
MAAPIDASRVTTSVSAAATAHNINVGSPLAGNLLVILVRFNGAPGTVTFAGFTQLAASTTDASDDDTRVYYRDTDGAEGVADPLSTVNAVKLAGITWVITAAEPSSVAVPTISTVAIGTTAANTCNPGSVAPTGAPRDTLYLALGGMDGAGTWTAAPANYTNLTTINATGGAVATQCSVAGASRQILASNSDDPGVFTHAAANAGWTGWTVAIRAYTVGDFEVQPPLIIVDKLRPNMVKRVR